MPMASALTFASAFTLTMQFLIFVYLYSFHRERFFLNRSYYGLYVPGMVWRQLSNVMLRDND